MNSFFARTFSPVIFVVVVLCLLGSFIFGSKYIRVDTNLHDLNPEQVVDQGLKFATDTLTQDIGHRFIVLVKANKAIATQEKVVSNAARHLQEQLAGIQGIVVSSNYRDIQSYLSVLSPYQFNLLSDLQRESLTNPDIDELATQAQRKLYQLGDGIRLFPFEQDPLGFFSDYLLSRIDEFDEVQTAYQDDAEAPSDFEYFTITITDYPENMMQQQRLYQAIKTVTTAISKDYPVTILHSGMFFFVVDSAQSAKGDIQLIAIGSVIGVIALMLLVFRSLLPLFLSLGSIAIGVSFGILMSTLVYGSIHIFTIVFGASLIGIVVDYSLHYFYHFLSSPRQESHGRQVAIASQKTLQRAMLLSVVTSLIGYGALTFSDLVLLKKIALFSCSGLIMAWLSVMIFGPLVIKRPIVARQNVLVAVLIGLHKIFACHPRKLMTLGLLLTVLGGVYLTVFEVKTNDDPRLFFHVSADLIAQEQEVASLTQMFEPGRYFIVSGQSEARVYQVLEAFYQELGEHRNSVVSVLDWLPSPAAQLQNYALQNVLYKDGGVLDNFYQKLGVSAAQSYSMKQAYAEADHRILDFGGLVRSLDSIPPLWIEHDETIYSFVLIKKNSDLAALEAISQEMKAVQYINTLGRAIEALESQRVTGSTLLLVAYALIALMLVVYYRQLHVLCLLLIPITASVITLSALAAIGQPITVFHIMALFLVLGLGMDYIIFAKEMTDNQTITQQAILLSAVTSLLSFGLLAFSSMPIVQAFGSTILIGNSINFIAAISLFNKWHSYT